MITFWIFFDAFIDTMFLGYKHNEIKFDICGAGRCCGISHQLLLGRIIQIPSIVVQFYFYACIYLDGFLRHLHAVNTPFGAGSKVSAVIGIAIRKYVIVYSLYPTNLHLQRNSLQISFTHIHSFNSKHIEQLGNFVTTSTISYTNYA